MNSYGFYRQSKLQKYNIVFFTLALSMLITVLKAKINFKFGYKYIYLYIYSQIKQN
jgi:hypothetical protein